MLIIRGAGPIGYPGGRSRQHATPFSLAGPRHSFSALHRRWPTVRHFGLSLDTQRITRSRSRGNLAILRTGDRIRIDLRRGTADMLVSQEEIETRQRPRRNRRFQFPESHTPWQEIRRHGRAVR